MNAEMDVVKFSVEDVIATSTEEEERNPNCENEGPIVTPEFG